MPRSWFQWTESLAATASYQLIDLAPIGAADAYDLLCAAGPLARLKALTLADTAPADVTVPADVTSIYIGGTFGGQSVASGPITIDRVVQGTEAQIAMGKTGNTEPTATQIEEFVVKAWLSVPPVLTRS